MLFSEKLEELKNNLPSQYRDNVIDYETLKNGINEVVESLNKTGIYDLQCHNHLIMENGMKTNIDNHIRETFKKSKVVVDDNTLIEVFDDENVISTVSDNGDKLAVKKEEIPDTDINKENESQNLPPKYNEQLPHQDASSVTSIFEKDFHYNFKVDLEEEIKKSQVKLVKFINQAKDKEEIIKNLSLKYYQIFYVLKDIEKEDGSKQLQSNLMISIHKVNPEEFDVQKLLDEITGQNSEIFEHNEEENCDNADDNVISNYTNEGEEIKEEKIDTEHLQQLMESLKDKNQSQSNSSIENDNDEVLSNGIPDKIPVPDSRKSSNQLNSPNDLETFRLMKSPTDFKIDEHMLGRTQCFDSTDLKDKRKDSYYSQYSSSSLDSDQDQDNESEDMFEFQDDDDIKIVLPKSYSQQSVPKEKEIEPDPVAVMGDSDEMIKKRASIIQRRLSEYNCDDGISKEKFMSLFNSKKCTSSSCSNSSINGRKVSFASSLPSSFYHSSRRSSVRSSIEELEVQNHWEIPIYSYYTFSLLSDEELNEISSEIPNTQEPETIEILEIKEVESNGKASRQSSSSSINTAKNSPKVKILKVSNEPAKNENAETSTSHEKVTSSVSNVIHFSPSQSSSTATLNFYTESQSVVREKRRTSFSNLFKKSNKNSDTFKTYDQLFDEERRKKLDEVNKRSSYHGVGSECVKDSALYVRKTKSHSFSYHFKNPFKRLSSKRSLKKQSVSFSAPNPLNECESITSDHLNELEHIHCSCQNKEKRVEISLDSDTTFLNRMVAIFKNLTLFERDCQTLFESNISATKKMLTEVSAPGKLDTYPWRSLNRLYREVDVWTHNGKVNTWQQATDKLELFKIKAESFTKKFKMEESPIVFEQFLKLNRDAITFKQFYEINQTAIYMVLKEHDKDTKLSACEGLPGFVSTDFFSDNACKHLTYELTQDLLNVIPDPEKYSCPICQELAYKPIRLDCGHLFCLKCLIKAQKKNLDNCPVCRAKDAVKNATSKNLDKKLLKLLTSDYPKEIKARKKQIREINRQQEIEDAKEYEAQPASLKNNEEEEACIIM
eukprot:jgi/Orpsp1_1/1178205/evm.model.c7180000064415.1